MTSLIVIMHSNTKAKCKTVSVVININKKITNLSKSFAEYTKTKLADQLRTS